MTTRQTRIRDVAIQERKLGIRRAARRLVWTRLNFAVEHIGGRDWMQDPQGNEWVRLSAVRSIVDDLDERESSLALDEEAGR